MSIFLGTAIQKQDRKWSLGPEGSGVEFLEQVFLHLQAQKSDHLAFLGSFYTCFSWVQFLGFFPQVYFLGMKFLGTTNSAAGPRNKALDEKD